MNRIALPAVIIALLALIGWLALSPSSGKASNSSTDATIDTNNLSVIGYSQERLAEIEQERQQRDLDREEITSSDTSNHSAQLEYGSASFIGYLVDPLGNPAADVYMEMAVSHKWQSSFDPDNENLITIWEASTAEDGFFFFPAAEHPQADYLLQIDAEGFPVKQIENLKANIGFSRDLGIIRLATPSFINGKIVDDNGHPIARAIVESYISLDSGDYQLIETLEAVSTDNGGLFKTGELPARDIYLQASADGYLTEVSPKIKLKEGEEFTDLTITLPSPQIVSGKVIDENNQPIVNAAVSQADGHDSVDSSVKTYAGGDFELPINPDRSEVTVIVEAEGYRIRRLHLKDFSVTTTITLREMPTISGMVRDHNQRPLAGAEVVLCARSLSTQLVARSLDLERCNGHATTDEYGNFQLTPTDIGADNARLKLVAFNDSHPPAQYWRAITFVDRGNNKSEQYNDIIIDLKKGFAVSGSVKNTDGSSIKSTQILLRKLAKPRRSRLPSTEVRRGGDIIDQVIVDASSNFEFLNLESGEYRVEAYHRDYSPTQSDDFSLIDVNYECLLVMKEPGGISGQFIGDTSLYPNLVVQATSPGLDLIQVKPEADGSFQLMNLMPGTYSLEAHDVLSANRGQWWQGAQVPIAELDGIEVTAGNYTQVNLELNNSGFASVSGHVEINGEPAVSYKIFAVPHIYGAAAEDQRMVVRENVMHMREARTNPDGQFEINGIVPNDYWIIVEGPDSNRRDMAAVKPTGLSVREINIDNPQQYQVDFNILTGSVKVIPQQDKNIRGMHITLVPVPDDGRNRQRLYVPASGPRVHEGIPVGAYEWSLKKKDESQQIFVTPSSVIEMKVTLPKITRTGGLKKVPSPR
jgi:hypothetical protein